MGIGQKSFGFSSSYRLFVLLFDAFSGLPGKAVPWSRGPYFHQKDCIYVLHFRIGNNEPDHGNRFTIFNCSFHFGSANKSVFEVSSSLYNALRLGSIKM